ncbi:MAG: septal ring lytic transglycosylase RlpA family protein [Treponema sp.]|nr:septal ring lytic transglycosylase RlpA family protein [Treponema sp.]
MQVGGRIPPGMGWIAAIPFTAGSVLGVKPGDNVVVRIAPSVPEAEKKPRAIRSSLRKFNQMGVALNRSSGTGLTAGHPSLSIGTKIRVTNRSSGQQLTVSIADRIRASQSRVIELSQGAAQRLGITRPTEVSIESVDN